MPRKIVPNMSTPIVSSMEVEDNRSKNVKERSITGVLKKFATVTTAHGPFHIAISDSSLSRIFWTIMLILAGTLLTWQTYELIADFNAYNTASELVHSESVDFPAVTVCNVNRMKRSLLTFHEKFSDVVRLDGGWQRSNFEDYDWFWEEVPDWWDDYAESLVNETSGTNDTVTEYPDEERDRRRRSQQDYDPDVSEDFVDYVYNDYGIKNSDCENEDYVKFFETLGSNNIMHGVNRLFTPTRNDFKELGHKKEDFILQCSFNGKKCSHKNFTTFQNHRYGNCFTFNSASDEATVSKAGSYYGLHLTLFIEEPEYVGVFSEETGARLLVHPRDIFPHIDDLGVTLPPGFATQIGIRQVEIIRLSLPYYNCSRGKADGHFTMESRNYSIISCQKRCLLDAMRQKCGCVSEIYDQYAGVRLCSCKDDRCRQRIEDLYVKNSLECECPPPCNEIIYNTQLSSSSWPARRYQEHLIDKLSVDETEAARVLADPRAVRNNLVRVKVYFQELNYERVQQSPKHTIPSLFGAIGGIFGLYVGFSIFTFAELVVLFFDILNTFLLPSDV